MSEDLRLPDDRLPKDRLPQDLAAIEARLAAHALPAPGLNRDELFYQAGWAACEARFSRATNATLSPESQTTALRSVATGDRARLLPSLQGRGAIAAWSAASAALAASLAVAATLALTSNGSPGDRELAVDARRPPAAVVEDSLEKAPSAAPPRDDVARVLASFDALLRSDRTASSGSLVTALGGAGRMRWDEPIVTSANRGLPSAAPAAATPRGLLEELLPGARPSSAPAGAEPWFQRFTTFGEETI